MRGFLLATAAVLAITSLSHAAVGVQNHNIILNPDQTRAWVTNNNEGTVSVIDTATDNVINGGTARFMHLAPPLLRGFFSFADL